MNFLLACLINNSPCTDINALKYTRVVLQLKCISMVYRLNLSLKSKTCMLNKLLNLKKKGKILTISILPVPSPGLSFIYVRIILIEDNIHINETIITLFP